MISIIPTQTRHLDSIWAIEQQVHCHPWSKNTIFDLSSRGAMHHVMLDDERVVGYFYAQNIVGEVTLLNIAMAKEVQNKGLGRQLLSFLITHCENLQAESIWLEVRESNHNAIYLYESAGFNEIDRRRNYYPTEKGREDALIMTMTL